MVYLQNKNFDLVEIKESEVLELVKNKFVVALDFDGVITNPHKLKADYINKLGYNLTEENSSREQCIAQGVKKEHYEKESIKAYTENPAILPLEEDLIGNFQKIRKLPNLLIFVLTSRFDYMIQHLKDYLKFHKIKIDGVINTNNTNKSESLNKINPNLFVEDTLSKLLGAKKNYNGSTCKFILYRNIQNKKDTLSDKGLKDVNGWKDLSEMIINEYNKIFK